MRFVLETSEIRELHDIADADSVELIGEPVRRGIGAVALFRHVSPLATEFIVAHCAESLSDITGTEALNEDQVIALGDGSLGKGLIAALDIQFEY